MEQKVRWVTCKGKLYPRMNSACQPPYKGYRGVRMISMACTPGLICEVEMLPMASLKYMLCAPAGRCARKPLIAVCPNVVGSDIRSSLDHSPCNDKRQIKDRLWAYAVFDGILARGFLLVRNCRGEQPMMQNWLWQSLANFQLRQNAAHWKHLKTSYLLKSWIMLVPISFNMDISISLSHVRICHIARLPNSLAIQGSQAMQTKLVMRLIKRNACLQSHLKQTF